MHWSLLFVSIPPVVAYVLGWSAGRARIGVVLAVAVAALEVVYNSIQLGFIEPFSVFSFSLFGIFAAAFLRSGDDRIFKLQPVMFELGCAAVLFYYDRVLDVPLLAVIAEKHLGLFDLLAAYQQGYAKVYATTLSRSVPYLLLAHAALTTDAALKRSTWWWFNIRVFGVYGMLAVLFLAERLLGVTP